MSFVDTFSGIMGTGRYSIHSMDTYAVFLFGKRNVHICTLYFCIIVFNVEPTHGRSRRCFLANRFSSAYEEHVKIRPLRWIGKPSPTSRVMAPWPPMNG